MNTPLTVTERAELKTIGITQTQLSKRYHTAKKRADARQDSIMPVYQFYKEFTSQLKAMAKKLNSTPSQLFPLVDVHSVDGYTTFKLLLRADHKLLHSENYRKRAKEVLARGSQVCRHCGEEKPLTEFLTSKKTLTGIINTCKACDKKRRAELKEKREVA